ncbi:MAG TPA: LLM class flavin-dependent oxidoreductase [Candidatus Binataceae bacterium]|jgi:alkanesulfonate monooxygenase SsuD/methylene tetrahydromethanopterin reductase-like flavin-dependent oxidoreductase (luciferase family)
MRKVRFGYQLDFRNPPRSERSFATLYGDSLEQVELAEALGFDSIWLTEHHFTDDGYLPAMLPAAAAIAARTKRVTIGTFVLLAPFQHPLKLAEDAAVVDVISNGRLRLGLGQGYRQEEFDGFGVPRAERLGRTLETIEILKLAWTGQRFSFDGKYFHFKDVRVLPTPASHPYPELLWGAGAPKAIRRAAKMGLSFACVGGRKEMGIYTEALKEAGRNPADFSLVNSRVVYIAATAQQAWKEVGDALMYQAQHYGKWLSAAAGTSDMSQVLIRPDPERLKRTSILGPPEEVRARITAVIESGPITDLITVAQLPGLDPAKARRSLERFGREVLPAFK